MNKEGKGLIEIVPYSGGVLGRSYAQQAQLVLDGVADMAWVNPSLTPDLFPDDGVLEFPGLFRDLREATLVHIADGGGGSSCAGYEDFFVISAVANFPLMINTRPPIGSLADSARQDPSRQQPDRGQGAQGNRHHRRVVMPVNEVALAIGRGTLDGATMSPNSLVAYGVSRITRFHYDAPLGSGAARVPDEPAEVRVAAEGRPGRDPQVQRRVARPRAYIETSTMPTTSRR